MGSNAFERGIEALIRAGPYARDEMASSQQSSGSKTPEEAPEVKETGVRGWKQMAGSRTAADYG